MSEINKYINKDDIISIWPRKRSKQMIVLNYMIKNFSYNRIYTEKEVNEIINNNHTFNDYFLLRRELIDARLLVRTRSGSKYWRGDYVPSQYTTERLSIRDSKLEDEKDLDIVNMSCAYLEKFTGIKHESDYINEVLNKGDLPPKGKNEFYKVKTIIEKKSNTIIGFLEYYLGYPNQNTVWISTFYIKKDKQQNGYGKETIDSMKEYFENSTFIKVAIGVHLKNWVALRFWVRCEFKHIYDIFGDREFGIDKYATIALEHFLK